MEALPYEVQLAVFSFLPAYDVPAPAFFVYCFNGWSDAVRGASQLLERVPLVCQAWRHLAADSHLWRAHHRALFLGGAAGRGGESAADYRAKCAPAVRWLAHRGPQSTVGQRVQWACEQGVAGVVSALRARPLFACLVCVCGRVVLTPRT